MATAERQQSARGENQAVTRRRHESRRFRFTAEQFEQLSKVGVFGSRRVELLEGEVWEKMTTNPPHSIAAGLLGLAVQFAFGAGHTFRVGEPMDLGRRSQPEPDLAVVLGSPRDFTSHPKTALLVVEISDTTLRKDRILKSHIYAQAGIAEYWIVNLAERQVEVHRSPGPDPSRKGRFRYGEIAIVPADGSVAPLAAPGRPIAVADLLP